MHWLTATALLHWSVSLNLAEALTLALNRNPDVHPHPDLSPNQPVDKTMPKAKKLPEMKDFQLFNTKRIIELYEREHAAELRRVYRFLGVGAPRAAAAAAYRKATPDRLCDAIANYGALCRAYAAGPLAHHFDEPCHCTSSMPGSTR